jgi:hypothetical protein
LAGTIHSTASMRGGSWPASRREGAARGRCWCVPSSTSRRRSLGRAGSASGGGDVDAKELRAQGASVKEKGSRRKAKSRTSARCAVLKGTGLTLHLRRRARRVSKTFACTWARPGETVARNRDASIPTTCRLPEPMRGLMERSCWSHRARYPFPRLRPRHHYSHNCPDKIYKATTATITNKSSRASLQLTHELGGYSRRMRSRALLTDKRRIPLRSASVRTPHLFHHGIPKVLVNPRSKGITSVQSTTTH